VWLQRGALTYLVEGNMAISTDTAQKEVNPSCLLDGSLVVLALLIQVFGVAIENVGVLGASISAENWYALLPVARPFGLLTQYRSERTSS
jgi:hypothetical protein